MTDKIEPALSPEEWAQDEHGYRQIDRGLVVWQRIVANDPAPMNIGGRAIPASDLPALIALANAALPDDDPRKITRHSVWIVRKLIAEAYIDMQHPGALRFKAEAERFADALESYIPPEPT